MEENTVDTKGPTTITLKSIQFQLPEEYRGRVEYKSFGGWSESVDREKITVNCRSTKSATFSIKNKTLEAVVEKVKALLDNDKIAQNRESEALRKQREFVKYIESVLSGEGISVNVWSSGLNNVSISGPGIRFIAKHEINYGACILEGEDCNEMKEENGKSFCPKADNCLYANRLDEIVITGEGNNTFRTDIVGLKKLLAVMAEVNMKKEK